LCDFAFVQNYTLFRKVGYFLKKKQGLFRCRQIEKNIVEKIL